MSLRLKMIREQRIGVFLLVGAIFLLEVFIHREHFFPESVSEKELSSHLIKELSFPDPQEEKHNGNRLQPFDPNNYTQENWEKIGFSKKQASVILKYKTLLGGKFLSKEQIKSCFVISEKKYNELSSFLLLPEKDPQQQAVFTPSDKKYSLKNFNPNTYTLKNWMDIGFSEKQAEVILKYKNMIGGMFTSKEQIKKCFVISEKKYTELAPFIQLPEKEVSQQTPNNKTASVPVEKKELNSASFNDILSVIGDASIAKKVLGFRKGLGGFVSKDQLKDVYDITPEMVVRISEAFSLDTSKVRKINLSRATEEELQSQIYLRRYKDKIIGAQKAGKDPITVIPKSDPKYDFILLYLE
ncbi:MAG: helix-hairpin-helix domain-containing protein [Flavobacteriaceae bacterium]|jgi:DNA uptake protein ComE-like DNA-binding protein|nr:helix-hairpin-helix domain-containing protein [Flavobacteriaceae bacterium]